MFFLKSHVFEGEKYKYEVLYHNRLMVILVSSNAFCEKGKNESEMGPTSTQGGRAE